MAAYATVEEYRTDTGDTATGDSRVASTLDKQSAKLRALAGIGEGQALGADALLLCRELVTDAARKALAAPASDWGLDATGVSQASFSANGFQQSVQYANPSGSAYFDRSTLSALRRLLGRSQRAGTIMPSYGAPS